MDREEALRHVEHVVDDTGDGRPLDYDMCAIVRNNDDYVWRSVLVGWKQGSELVVVAVHSLMDVSIDNDEAAEIAADYLEGIGWFEAGAYAPDFVVE